LNLISKLLHELVNLLAGPADFCPEPEFLQQIEVELLKRLKSRVLAFLVFDEPDHAALEERVVGPAAPAEYA